MCSVLAHEWGQSARRPALERPGVADVSVRAGRAAAALRERCSRSSRDAASSARGPRLRRGAALEPAAAVVERLRALVDEGDLQRPGRLAAERRHRDRGELRLGAGDARCGNATRRREGGRTARRSPPRPRSRRSATWAVAAPLTGSTRPPLCQPFRTGPEEVGARALTTAVSTCVPAMRVAFPCRSTLLSGIATGFALLLVSGASAQVSNRDIAISGAVLRLDGAGRVHVLLSCAPDAQLARCRGLLRIVAPSVRSATSSSGRAGTTSRAAAGRRRS